MHRSNHAAVGVLLTSLLVAAGAGWAATPYDDPRNSHVSYYDAVNGANCYGCHEQQGFTAGTIGLARTYEAIQVDEPINLTMRLTHDSGKNQAIQEIRVIVNVSQAPNVLVLTDEVVPDFGDRFEMVLEDGADPEIHRVPVSAAATSFRVTLRALDARTLEPLAPDGALTLTVQDPAFQEVPTTGSATMQTVELDAARLKQRGTGNYSISAAWTGDLDPQMRAELVYAVNHTYDASEYTIKTQHRVASGQTARIPIPILVTDPGEAFLDFRVESVSFWQHSAGDGAALDNGLFYRFTTMRFEGADETRLAANTFAPTPLGEAVDLYALFTRIVGFVGALLIPVALVTGGVFGKRSRRTLNRWTGGAKRRVSWHVAMSWAIIGVASLHFVLALLEVRFAWTHGLLWGGVGWLLLVSLGFTGYYQTRMIKRWNYKVWRQVHLASALGVVAFVLVHIFVDGSDLAALREMVPGSERLIWPR